MPLDPKGQLAEAERAELERVVEALARWPRLSQLLRYVGEKLFSGELDQINEYNIATEVLGRSKTVFNAGEDAIARVETHRLRKRLAAFYETEGKDHPIQMNIPAGSYIPVFVHKPEQVPAAASPGPAPPLAPLPTASESNLHLKDRPASMDQALMEIFASRDLPCSGNGGSVSVFSSGGVSQAVNVRQRPGAGG